MGFFGDVRSLEGLFRVAGDVATKIGPAELLLTNTRIATDGTYVYVLEYHDNSTYVLRFEPATDTWVTIHEFSDNYSTSNIVVDGDYLIFSLPERVIRLYKNPQ